MTRYYIDLKEYAEKADISEVSNETLKEVIKDFLLEAQNRALTIPAVIRRSEQLKCAHQWRDSGRYFRCCKCGEYGNATT